MLHLKMLNLGFVLSLFLVPIVAKDVPPIGCNDLSCPKQGTDFRCKVEDNTFLGVGLAPIPNLPSDLEGFSLVKGVNVSAGLAGKNNDKPTRPFKSVYYLATPEDTEAQDIRGCAVIFNNPPEKKFKGPELEGINKTDTRAATGTCSDVIEQRCIDAIVQKARNVTGDTDGSICKKLEHELKGTFTGCSGFADHGSSLGNFSIKSFGDLGAVRNSSDCWPVQQKSDQLMDIGEVTSYANYSAPALIEEAYKITPVLTVFVGNGTSQDQTSQLTCLKVVDKGSIDEGGSENSAAVLSGSWLAVSLAAAFFLY